MIAIAIAIGDCNCGLLMGSCALIGFSTPEPLRRANGGAPRYISPGCCHLITPAPPLRAPSSPSSSGGPALPGYLGGALVLLIYRDYTAHRPDFWLLLNLRWRSRTARKCILWRRFSSSSSSSSFTFDAPLTFGALVPAIVLLMVALAALLPPLFGLSTLDSPFFLSAEPLPRWDLNLADSRRVTDDVCDAGCGVGGMVHSAEKREEAYGEEGRASRCDQEGG